VIRLLGYEIENGNLRPDPDRVKPLMDLPIPGTPKKLRRVIGLYTYYAKWVPKYSNKIKPSVDSTSFPLKGEALSCLKLIKEDLKTATLKAIDEDLPFSVETDASNVAISGILHQCGRPVAFFSRTLNPSERRYSAIEKEATAIVESVRNWSHLLLGRPFKLITDQNSVCFYV